MYASLISNHHFTISNHQSQLIFKKSNSWLRLCFHLWRNENATFRHKWKHCCDRCFSYLQYHEFFRKKYKENCTKAKFAFKLKSFEAKWHKVFLLLTMKYSFYWKFALNIKLNIVALTGSRLEINMNKYKKNLFSNILKLQPMAFQTVKTRSRLWQ